MGTLLVCFPVHWRSCFQHDGGPFEHSVSATRGVVPCFFGGCMGVCWLEWVADGADYEQVVGRWAFRRCSCWISVAVVLFVCHAVVGSECVELVKDEKHQLFNSGEFGLVPIGCCIFGVFGRFWCRSSSGWTICHSLESIFGWGKSVDFHRPWRRARLVPYYGALGWVLSQQLPHPRKSVRNRWMDYTCSVHGLSFATSIWPSTTHLCTLGASCEPKCRGSSTLGVPGAHPGAKGNGGFVDVT